MCAPTAIQKALAGLSRRELLSLGAAGLLATAAPAVVKTRLRSRTIKADHMVDLTHVLNSRFPVIPIPGLTFPFEQKRIASIEDRGVYANEWRLIEHNGTHIDAPSHFIKGQVNLEKVPVDSLIAPVAVIDVTGKVAKDHDYAVTPDDILSWEKKHGRLPRGAAVFMLSGWAKRANDAKEFLNLDSTHTMHFPGFAAETCEFLTREREISGVGVDTISFDIGPDKEYRAHKALFRAGKWGIECINNLETIPPSGATVFAGALKVEGASASPIRLIALF